MPSKPVVIFVFILPLFAGWQAAAQGLNFQLARVDFWRPATLADHWIVIKEDGIAGTPISGESKTSAWKNLNAGGVMKKPVAYVSGCHARIGACFTQSGEADNCPEPNPDGLPSGNPAGYYVRGEVVDQADQPIGISLPAKTLYKTGSGDVYEYPATTVSAPFEANRIQYFEKFRIRWEWSTADDPDGTWTGCGVSENPLYVTRKKPKDEAPGVGYRHFHTLLYIGCKYANGATEEEAMIQDVWEHFEGRAVKRVDGAPMKYYGDWSGGNLASHTDELIERKDGMCMAWTRLFLDVFKVQGFQESINALYVKPRISEVLFVKTWKKDVESGSSGNPVYPFANIRGTPFYLNNSYNWIQHEVVLELPSLAQNNSNPQSDFKNHIFARIKGNLYDPSYGVPYGQSEFVSDPLNPPEVVESVPIFDNNHISAYAIQPSAPIYYIRINGINDGDIIIIDLNLSKSH